jgi:hypothetical protein
VITATGIDPEVAALVYIAAFAPDRGERGPRDALADTEQLERLWRVTSGGSQRLVARRVAQPTLGVGFFSRFRCNERRGFDL